MVGVKSQADILNALRDKGVKQQKIADLLGVKQPNVATLYTPAKNGKLRKLSYDEGLLLISAFGLEKKQAEASPIELPSEETLQVVLSEVMRLSAGLDLPESKARPVARHLALFLELLSRNPAIHANPGAIKAVADAIGSQLPDARPEA